MNTKSIIAQVKSGVIHYCCFDCADKHSTQPAYDGTVTYRQGICEICKQIKLITPAKRLFGYYQMV